MTGVSADRLTCWVLVAMLTLPSWVCGEKGAHMVDVCGLGGCFNRCKLTFLWRHTQPILCVCVCVSQQLFGCVRGPWKQLCVYLCFFHVVVCDFWQWQMCFGFFLGGGGFFPWDCMILQNSWIYFLCSFRASSWHHYYIMNRCSSLPSPFFWDCYWEHSYVYGLINYLLHLNWRLSFRNLNTTGNLFLFVCQQYQPPAFI